MFSFTNNKNYMMRVELIADFEPYLKVHIYKQVSPGQGKSSYPSPKTCDEMIELMGRSVTEKYLNRYENLKIFFNNRLFNF